MTTSEVLLGMLVYEIYFHIISVFENDIQTWEEFSR